jgi:succinate dehydrogenase (ubiquinone) membrane anchor subunit
MRSTALRPSAMASRCAALRVNSIKAAAFHMSARRSAILPPGPQKIEGGVNDPAPIPEPNAAHGSYHWNFERALAAGMVPLTLAPFVAGSLNPTTDAVICAAVLLHSHMGFQQVIIDYIPKKRYPGLRKIFWWGLRAATLTVGVGLYEFETNDIGVTEAIKRVWTA